MRTFEITMNELGRDGKVRTITQTAICQNRRQVIEWYRLNNPDIISYSITEAKSKNVYYGINVGTFEDIIKLMNILYTDCGEAKLDKKYINFVKFEKLVRMNQEVNDIVGSKLKDLE